MEPQAFYVPTLFDYLAAFTWATSGAVVGIRKRYDIFGVFMIALISSTGGSIIRDGLFLHRTPPVLTNGVYLPLLLIATTFTSLFRRWITSTPMIDWLVSLIDAIGTPAFAVVGMQLSLQAGIALPGVVLIGVLNGFGGGLLRDVIVNDVPAVLRPGQYSASVVLVACVLFLVLTRQFGIETTLAAWTIVALYVVARMLIVYFDLRTRPVMPPEQLSLS
jgi:uncharacterized membrane protein YeiH